MVAELRVTIPKLPESENHSLPKSKEKYPRNLTTNFGFYHRDKCSLAKSLELAVLSVSSWFAPGLNGRGAFALSQEPLTRETRVVSKYLKVLSYRSILFASCRPEM